MQRVLIILLLTAAIPLAGQELSFVQVDTTTYGQYLRKEWKPLVQSCRKAYKSDIDYYYLRMREAYAYFAMGQFRKAIPAYKKALSFNSLDPTANEYLYYAYLYGGRSLDALFQTRQLNEKVKQRIGINDSSLFSGLGADLSYFNADQGAVTEELLQTVPPATGGIQKVGFQFVHPTIWFSHRLGKRVQLSYRAGYMSRREFSYVFTGGIPYVSGEQIVTQTEFYVTAQLRVADGLILKPAIQSINTRVPLFSSTSYGPNSGIDRLQVSQLETKEWIPSIRLELDRRYFNMGVSYSYFTFSEIVTNQFSTQLTVYPFGNLDLYGGMNFAVGFQSSLASSDRAMVVEPSLGFKLFPKLWVEFYGTPMSKQHFYNSQLGIAYNALDYPSKSAGITTIFPLLDAKLKLTVGYHYGRYASVFYPDSDPLRVSNYYYYNAHLLKVGISWLN